MSLSVATAAGSLPLAYHLYLPEEWAEDKAHRKRAGVPDEIAFAPKGTIARAQIKAQLCAGIPRGRVLIDAGYGDETALRHWLSARELVYAVGIRPATMVWCEGHQPARAALKPGRGRPRTRAERDKAHAPISVKALAESLPPSCYRTLAWREGTNEQLRSRFARVRVRAAHADPPVRRSGCSSSSPRGRPRRLASFKALAATVKMRWRIERDYRELKQEVGLGHYEGRNWRGFHHLASLCIAAYGFLMLERLSGF